MFFLTNCVALCSVITFGDSQRWTKPPPEPYGVYNMIPPDTQTRVSTCYNENINVPKDIVQLTLMPRLDLKPQALTWNCSVMMRKTKPKKISIYILNFKKEDEFRLQTDYRISREWFKHCTRDQGNYSVFSIRCETTQQLTHAYLGSWQVRCDYGTLDKEDNYTEHCRSEEIKYNLTFTNLKRPTKKTAGGFTLSVTTPEYHHQRPGRGGEARRYSENGGLPWQVAPPEDLPGPRAGAAETFGFSCASIFGIGGVALGVCCCKGLCRLKRRSKGAVDCPCEQYAAGQPSETDTE